MDAYISGSDPPPPFGSPPGGPFNQPPPDRPARRFLPYAVAAGALALAAAGFLAGHAAAGTAKPSQNLSSASAAGVNATQTAAATPSSGCQTNQRGAAGTLKAVKGNTLTVTSPRNGGKDVTVTTSGATKIQKTVSEAVSDITNGAVVTIRGTSTGPNAIGADQIAILPTSVAPTRPQPPAGATPPARTTPAGIAVGTVSKVANGSFTVTEPGGTAVTVTTSSTTKVVKTVSATVNQLTIGQPIAARGTADANGNIAATQVTQGEAGIGRGFGPGFGGPPGPGGFGRFRGAGGDGTPPASPPANANPAVAPA